MPKKIKPKHPSKEWEQGAFARKQHATAILNPYEINTSRFYRWREGWEYEDQEIKARARRG
jgi:hypothetical protein